MKMVCKKGSITIYVCLVFTTIISLICGLIYSVKINTSITTMEIVNSAGIDSTFSNYNRELLEEFGIFGLKCTDKELEEAIVENISRSLDVDNVLLPIELVDVNVIHYYRLADNYNGLFSAQVIDYMKYAVPLDIGSDIINSFLKIDKNSPTKTVTEKLITLTDDLYCNTELMYHLISSVDGVLVEGMDVVNEGKEIPLKEKYAKKLVRNPGYHNIGINEKYICATVTSNAYDPCSDLFKLKSAYINYIETDEDNPEKRVEYLVEIQSYIDTICKNTQIALEGYKEAKNHAAMLFSSCTVLEKQAREMEKYLKDNKESLNEEIYEGLLSEIENYKNISKKEVNKICNVEDILEGINRNSNILEELLLLEELSFNSNSEDIQKYNLQFIENVNVLILGYKVEDLAFDYNNIHIWGDGMKNPLEILKKLYDQGVLEYVVKGEISNKYLPERYELDKGEDRIWSGADKITKTLLYDEYVMEKFVSVTDKDTGNHLNYELEYILQGYRSDRENLAKTISDIIAIREPLNLAYLYTDAQKMQEVELLALSLAGATQIPGLVTIVKFVLLALWAYGESIVDARILVEGGKLELYKTKASWNVSLDNVLSLTLEPSDKKKVTGNGYEDYIRFLLFLENYEKKTDGTLNLIEMHMINLTGDAKFRIEQIYVGADVISTYRYNATDEYIKTAGFIY